ncbi:4a-hydroxytetrahydrobiopterin dehydratase [bacterium]|nr:4a-hydroxytetrahydrobiopterin dehydratase [bacterium]
MEKLSMKECIPCKGGIPPLKGEELKRFQSQLDDTWKVIDEHRLENELLFKNFKDALSYLKQKCCRFDSSIRS